MTRPWRPAVGGCRPQVAPRRWDDQRRSSSLQVDPRQDYLEVGACVAFHVGLNDGISTILEPSDTVGDDTRILTTVRKCLVSATARVGVDRRKVDHVLSLNELNDGIGRGHGAVGYSRENEPIRTRPASQRVRIDPRRSACPRGSSSSSGRSDTRAPGRSPARRTAQACA